MASDLLDRLRALEIELHRLETRKNRDRLEQLLHPDFVEVARSGRRYSHREVLAEFSESDATLEPVHAEQFELVELDRGISLLTYLSAHEAKTGALSSYTLRSSVWVETEAGWRMRFHQGTPADLRTVGAEAALGGA